MDGWLDGRMDGWMEGRKEETKERKMEKQRWAFPSKTLLGGGGEGVAQESRPCIIL